jgi:hypothetical protein
MFHYTVVITLETLQLLLCISFTVYYFSVSCLQQHYVQQRYVQQHYVQQRYVQQHCAQQRYVQ